MATSFLQVKNNASGVLLSDIAPATSAATLAAGQGANFPSTGTFHVTIDSEILQVTSRATDILTLGTRGAELTTAASHLANADVRLNITAKHLTDVGTAINGLEAFTHNSGSYVAQDLFYASGTAQTARLAVGGTGNYLGVSAAGTLAYSNPGGAAWKPDQDPTGTVNGTNTVYVVPDAVYMANSLQVSLNGQLLTHGSDFAETTPTGGTFTMVTAPASGAVLRANYLISQTPSANADTVDGFHASATALANTIVALNGTTSLPASGIDAPSTSHITLTAGSAKFTKVSAYRKNITSNVWTGGSTIIQYGWGYLQGNNTAQISESVTFGTPFATIPIILTQILNSYMTSVPTALNDSQTAAAQLQVAGAHVHLPTTASFTVLLNRVANNFASGTYYPYLWMALGEI